MVVVEQESEELLHHGQDRVPGFLPAGRFGQALQRCDAEPAEVRTGVAHHEVSMGLATRQFRDQEDGLVDGEDLQVPHDVLNQHRVILETDRASPGMIARSLKLI